MSLCQNRRAGAVTMNSRKRTVADSVDSMVTCAGGRGLDRPGDWGSFSSGETSGTPGTRERVAEVNQIRQQSDPGAL